MSKHHTAQNWLFDGAPPKVDLRGDKRRPESATHIIEFPGGAIELSRTDEGEYWAHILVNRGWSSQDQRGQHAAIGEVVGSRITRRNGEHRLAPVRDIDADEDVEQIAILIKPVFPRGGA